MSFYMRRGICIILVFTSLHIDGGCFILLLQLLADWHYAVCDFFFSFALVAFVLLGCRKLFTRFSIVSSVAAVDHYLNGMRGGGDKSVNAFSPAASASSLHNSFHSLHKIQHFPIAITWFVDIIFHCIFLFTFVGVFSTAATAAWGANWRN